MRIFYQFLKVPLGTGLAFAIKYRKEDKVCMCMYGDGGANQGQVCELVNKLHTAHANTHTCSCTHMHTQTHKPLNTVPPKCNVVLARTSRFARD